MNELETDQLLNLTEIFTSIQGETSYFGLPTCFIRLAACNLRCTWCDTPYSFSKGEKKSFEEILEYTKSSGTTHVCVTGGEPLLQKNVYSLMTHLCDLGYTVSLETGGSLTIEEVDSRVITILDIKCPESGMSHKNHWANLNILRPLDEVKFVVKNEADYRYALGVCKKYQLFERTPWILLSPVFEALDPKDLIDWMKRDKIQARLNLQMHKYIWTPETVGV